MNLFSSKKQPLATNVENYFYLASETVEFLQNISNKIPGSQTGKKALPSAKCTIMQHYNLQSTTDIFSKNDDK